MEETPPSTPHCRLCLTAYPDSNRSDDNLLDIFRDDTEAHFSFKIRDCTGVFLSPEDGGDDSSPVTVCLNCAETVHFIDEFRSLCRRSEAALLENAAAASVERCDLARCEAYRHHVGQLRKLLGTAGDDGEAYLTPEVKQEEEEEEAAVSFEWADAEDMLEIKHELDGSGGEDNLEEVEDVPRRKRAKIEPDVDQLSLAKAIHAHPELWDSSHDGFHVAIQRERAWTKLASTTELEKAQLKREFNRLHELYRRKRWSSEASGDELYQWLESMFSSRKAGRQRPSKEVSVDERLQLAQVMHEHPEIWNKKHSAYDKPTKWTKIADQLGMEVDELKRQWKCLRDVYHSRKRRLATGIIEADNPLLQEPLYFLLEEMVECTISKRKLAASLEEAAPNERMKLAEAIYEKEIIWNRVHPQYSDQLLRDRTFQDLAAERNISADQLKQRWRKLRDFYRLRCSRVMKGQMALDDPQLNDPLYLLLKKMLRENMEVGKRSANAGEQGETAANIAIQQDDKLALAQAFYEREIIWNPTHPQNAVKASREAAWTEMAEQHSMSVPELKTQWRYLRDGYRVKWKRLQANPNDESAIQSTLNPLYLLMDQMIREGAPPSNPTPELTQAITEQSPAKLRRPRLNYNVEFRLRIANAIHEQEILWDTTHPEYADHVKREQVWNQLATQLNLSQAELKQQWKLLRDLYRGRMVRFGKERKIPPQHPFMRQKLFRQLDQMLRDSLGKRKRRRNNLVKGEEDDDDDDDEASGGEASEGGGGAGDEGWEGQDKDGDGEEKKVEKWGKPFDNQKLRARLAQEIEKHEMLWNINHVDYSRGSLRGQVWTKISDQFGLDRGHAVTTWTRVTHRHRKMRELYGTVAPDLRRKDPLHRFLHEVVYGGTDAKATTGDGEAQPAAAMPPKRRYTGKKVYSDEGCIMVVQNGIKHYFKVCEQCGKNVERSDFEYHMNRHNGLTPYACSYEGCDKRYGSKITRDRHEILVHTADAERFECELCGQKFKYRSKLDYHHAMNHQSQNLPCPICGKDMKHKHALRHHMDRIHKKAGHACPKCDRVLQTKYSLDVHMRIHTNEKPYPCVLCGQCFRLKVLLKTHLAKKHNVAIEELEGAGPSGSG